jgi:hypothetical protein
MVVMSKSTIADETNAAKLLWQLKAIATKEVASLPLHTIDSFFLLCPSTSEDSTETAYSYPCLTTDARKRTISLESVEEIMSNTVTPILSYTPVPRARARLIESRPFLLDSDDEEDEEPDCSMIDHHDWSNRARILPSVTKSMNKDHIYRNHHPISHRLLGSPEEAIKQCKRKRESFVGLTTSNGTVRCTLRKKVSIFQGGGDAG